MEIRGRQQSYIISLNPYNVTKEKPNSTQIQYMLKLLKTTILGGYVNGSSSFGKS